MCKCIATCLSNFIYKFYKLNALINTLFIFIEFKCEFVYEVLYYCIVINKDHNAEKAFSVTTFGFEIKIMDKCYVCGKQPRISSKTANVSCVEATLILAAFSLHT